MFLILFLCLQLPAIAQEVEFFIDIDPGYGHANSFPLNEGLALDTLINGYADQLDTGLHLVGFRVKMGSESVWGLTKYKLFYVPQRSLTVSSDRLDHIKYAVDASAFDENASRWEINSDTNSQSIFLDKLIQLDDKDGLKRFEAIPVSENGVPGFSVSMAIYVANKSLAKRDLSAILSYEYRFGQDTEIKKWTPLADTNLAESFIDTLLSPSDSTAGSYTFWIRPVQSSGRKGLFKGAEFVIPEEPLLQPPQLLSPADSAIQISLRPTLQWQEVDQASTYKVRVGVDPLFETIVVDSSLISETVFLLQDTLDYDSKYYWSVKAIGEAIESPWSNTFEFRTIVQLPEQPILAIPLNDAEDVTIRPIFRWNRISKANSYQFLLAEDTLNSTPITFKEEAEDTLFIQEETLNYDQVYYWRVLGTNLSGNGEWSDWGRFRTQIAPPESPSLLQPQNGALKLPQEFQIQWSASSTAQSYDLQLSRSASFQQVDLNLQSLPDTSIIVTDLGYLTSYYWRVRAVNSTGPGEWSTVFSFKTEAFIPELSTVPIFTSISASADLQTATSYRMISLPGNYDEIAVSSIFRHAGDLNKDWNVYTDNGSESNYLQSQQAQALTFVPGKAFWYISKNPIELEYEFAKPRIEEDNTLRIPLRPGWNMIASMLNQERINWSAISSASDVSQPIWDYQARWIQSDEMLPMRGYYFFNAEGREELIVPLASVSKMGISAKIPAKKDYLRIQLKSPIEKNSSFDEVQIAIHKIDPSIEEQNQEIDILKPLTNWDNRALWIQNFDEQNASTRSSKLWEKFINHDSLSVLRIHLKAFSCDQLHFSAMGSFLNHHDYLYLRKVKDYSRDWLIDLTQANAFIELEEGENEYELIIGKRDGVEAFVEQERANLLPEKMQIEQIYPNPFNPITNIQLVLPEAAEIRLEIFNTLGQQVALLQDGLLREGRHHIQWNAQGLATGVYFLRVLNKKNGQVELKSLTLIK